MISPSAINTGGKPMTKIDDLWLYDQAQQEVAKIDNRLKTTPNRARLNKLHSFLSEQQAQVVSLTRQIEARGAALTKLSALCQDLERRLELELSEFSTMENDEECTAAEMTEARKSMEGLMDQITSARKDITDAIAFLEKATADYKETYTRAGKAKNAVYNKAKQTICILDNSTTAMTGHQPHPGTGMTMMDDITDKISIPKILKAMGVEPVLTVDPFNQKKAVEAVKKCDEHEGVSAIIFKAPCIALLAKEEYKQFRKPASKVKSDKCIGCRKCVNETGCPALGFDFDLKKATINTALCTGCSLCSQVCPVKAIK